ncbi:transposase [Komagataeibacter europaeus NBRC 3261]|uniref:Transposase n=1 Tax=Komagataeibacter europaeus NBRC 3261 TaxID=1234669 RepID=A0A0D6Q094_KOMEU|nr:transposase [Komagataeibacter europaeus NBRC 3261]
MSDHRGARILLPVLPDAHYLTEDKGHDSARFRDALASRGIEPGILSTKTRGKLLPYNRHLFGERYKAENLFGKIKDWRRIATRYDRCAHTFFSAICLAATIIFWML